MSSMQLNKHSLWPVTEGGSAGLHLMPSSLQHLHNYLDEGLELLLSKYANDTKLGGDVDSLKGRAVLQRGLWQIRDGQSPTIWRLTRANDGFCICGRTNPGVDTDREVGEQPCRKGSGSDGEWQIESQPAVPWQPGELRVSWGHQAQHGHPGKWGNCPAFFCTLCIFGLYNIRRI